MPIHPREFRKRYATVATSQSGEDGIIAELARRCDLPPNCIEFGAGDGLSLSNTHALWADRGWRALLIEADGARYAALEARTEGLANVTPLRSFVTASGETSLRAAMDRAGFTGDVGVLSIDIDANDLELFEALDHPRFHVVVLEFNFEFPASIDYRDPPGTCVFRHSAKASLHAARGCGFEAVCCIGANLVLVNRERHALDWLVQGAPIEEMFDEAFRVERMRNPRIVRSKSTTRAVAFTESPSLSLRAAAAVSTMARSVRGRHSAGPETAAIPPGVAARLERAGLFL